MCSENDATKPINIKRFSTSEKESSNHGIYLVDVFRYLCCLFCVMVGQLVNNRYQIEPYSRIRYLNGVFIFRIRCSVYIGMRRLYGGLANMVKNE